MSPSVRCFGAALFALRFWTPTFSPHFRGRDSRPRSTERDLRGLAALLWVGFPSRGIASDADLVWVGTWATSPQLAAANDLPPPPGFREATLRQIVHVSLGAKRIRLHLSNE